MEEKVKAKAYNWQNALYIGSISLIMLFGSAIRLYVYSLGRSFWLDEASLVLNILEPSSILDSMAYGQAAPPIFKAISIFMFNFVGVGNYMEYALRLFPLVCGILSLPAFFVLSRKILTSKLAQVIALFLFAINHQLIYFSSEFKPYCSDMLIALLIVYLFIQVNVFKCSKNKLALMTLGLAVSFWLSHASLFVLAGMFVACCWLYDKKELPIKQFLVRIFCLFLPSLISFICFWYLHLKTVAGSEFMYNYWADSFITGFSAFVSVSQKYLIDSFTFIDYSVIVLVGFIVVGVGYLLRKNLRIATIVLAPFIVVFSAAFLSVYPISYRLELFLLPFIIIFLAAVFDFITIKRPVFLTIVILVFMWTFGSYFYPYLSSISKKSLWLREEMGAIYEYLQKNNDISIPIVLPESATKQDLIYKKIYPLKNEKIFISDSKELGYTKSSFEKLKSGQSYFIVYLNHDTKRKKLYQLVDWMKNNTHILHQHIYHNNYVFYVLKK